MSDAEKKGFKREVENMKLLNNIFIIKYYEAFEENDRYYIATEYANGGSLDKFLAK